MNTKEFDVLWDKIILKEGLRICNDYSNLIFLKPLKDAVYQEIKYALNHCKNFYMSNPENFVDRHKVSAAVMIAILKCAPIKIVGPEYYSEDTKNWCFNEHLAITVGLSVLGAFAITQKKRAEDFESVKKYENGFIFPSTTHGDYRSNWATELYYTAKEGNYNMLALAHELFFLEHLVEIS